MRPLAPGMRGRGGGGGQGGACPPSLSLPNRVASPPHTQVAPTGEVGGASGFQKAGYT